MIKSKLMISGGAYPGTSQGLATWLKKFLNRNLLVAIDAHSDTTTGALSHAYVPKDDETPGEKPKPKPKGPPKGKGKGKDSAPPTPAARRKLLCTPAPDVSDTQLPIQPTKRLARS